MGLFDGPTFGGPPPSPSSFGAASPLGTGGAASNGISGQLQQSLQNLQDAVNSGNQRQYDLALGQLMGVFNGQNTLEEQKLMGIGANGKPTLDAQTLAEKQRQYDLSTQAGLLDTASKLTGPKDYGDFMRFTGGGQSLNQQLMAGRPASSAPVGDMEPMDLYALMQKFGMGPGQSPAANPAPAPNVGGGGTSSDPNNPDALPADSSMFPQTANDADIAFAKQEAQSGQGYDPNAYQKFVSSTNGTPDWTPITMGAPGNLGNQATWDAFVGQHPVGTNTSMDNSYQNLASALAGFNVFPNWRNNQVDPSNTDLQNYVNAFHDYYMKTGVWGQPPEAGQFLKSQIHNGNIGPVAAAPGPVQTGTGEPSWFKDYMSALTGLGPNVNRGAAENLPLLAQLGLNNPNGMGQMLNPAGNIDPAKWDSLGPVGQSLLQQAAGKVFGWDPTAFLSQINATRPLGSPVGGTSVGYAPLALAQ